MYMAPMVMRSLALTSLSSLALTSLSFLASISDSQLPRWCIERQKWCERLSSSRGHVLQSPRNTLNIWEYAWDGPFCQREFAGALPMPEVLGWLHHMRASAFHANRSRNTSRSLRNASSARSATHLNRHRCGTMQEVLLLQHTPLFFVQV